ncbi:50S ribosomal protein L1 [Patescibacteria group bacterium]|nr:50S ribosomal protein L1 [Patescibacteria group bacterium]
MKRGKKYQNIIKNRKEINSLIDALGNVKDLSTSNFSSKIECHIALNLGTKNNNQALKGSVTYKYKVGNDKKILVLTDKPIKGIKEDDNTIIGLNEYIDKIKDGWVDFDVLITTPDIMPQITLLGNILGPKSLMPNVKNGTITNNLEETINEYRKGKIDFKSDQTGVIHTIIGSTANSKEELLDNLSTLIKGISAINSKPINSMIKSMYITPTMGPSIKIDASKISELL